MKVNITDSYGNDADFDAQEGESIYSLLLRSHLELDSPCHGNGSCHKCRIMADGRPALACALNAADGMKVVIPKMQGVRIKKK